MTKVAIDLLTYVRGSGEFMPIETAGDPWLYPIDFEFALRNEARHFSPKDAAGLPIMRYQSVGDQYNPTRMAAFALGHWNRLRGSSIEASRAPFLRSAQWFLDSAERGMWLYRFDWGDLRAPWVSCVAQGEGISVLTRAALLTGDERFTLLAREALSCFRHDVAEGGVRGRLPDGSPFFEEYPSRNAIHVLNGYLFALIGLVDLNRIDPSDDVVALLDDARATLERHLHLWDIGGWSTYDLHHPERGPRNLCTANYHRLHATQLGYLGTTLRSAAILQWAERWEQTGRSLRKRLLAAAGKIGYRLRHPAQR